MAKAAATSVRFAARLTGSTGLQRGSAAHTLGPRSPVALAVISPAAGLDARGFSWVVSPVLCRHGGFAAAACLSSSRASSSTSSSKPGADDGKSQGSDGQKEEKDSSDKRHAETGEYDTQDASHRVGNPISWANPTGGGVVDDNSSNYWRYIYPAGAGFILLLCVYSGWKNRRRQQEDSIVSAPDIKMTDTSSFTTPKYSPPDVNYGSEEQHGDSQLMQQGWSSTTSSGGGGSFSAPPSSGGRGW